jgi:hypothetical protein
MFNFLKGHKAEIPNIEQELKLSEDKELSIVSQTLKD